MRRTWMLAVAATLLAACAMPAKRGTRAYGPASELETSDGRRSESTRRWGVGDWERYQQRNLRTLTQLAGSTLRERPPVTTPVTPGTSPRPVPPRRRPEPKTPPPDAPSPGGGGTSNVSDKQTLRCRRICRHVRAICHAAVRVCRIASRLNDPPAQQACRRSRSRCTDARALARRNCQPCGIRGQRQSCTPTRYARLRFWQRLVLP